MRVSEPGNQVAMAPTEVCAEMVIFGISACNIHGFNPDCLQMFDRQRVLDSSVSICDSYDTSNFETENISVLEDSWETVSMVPPAAERDSLHALDLEDFKELSAAGEIGEHVVNVEEPCSLDPTFTKIGLQDRGPSKPLTTRVRAESCKEIVMTAEGQCFFTTTTVGGNCEEDGETEEACSFVTAATELYDEEDETTEEMCSFITAAAEVCDDAIVGDTTICNRYGYYENDLHYVRMPDMRDHSVSSFDSYDPITFEAEPEAPIVDDSWETVSTSSEAGQHNSCHALDLEECEIKELSFAYEIGVFNAPGSQNPFSTKDDLQVSGPGSTLNAEAPAEVEVCEETFICGISACHTHGFNPICLQGFSRRRILDRLISILDIIDSHNATSFKADIKKKEHDSFHALDLKGGCNDVVITEEPLSPAITKSEQVTGPSESSSATASSEVVASCKRTCNGYLFDPDCLHCFGPEDIFDNSMSLSDNDDPATVKLEVKNTSSRAEKIYSFSPTVAQDDSFHSLNPKQRKVRDLVAAGVYKEIVMDQSQLKDSRKSSLVRQPLTTLRQPSICF
ncbi:hypothetical protein V1509DRAFT_621292 [Lipomyces kononenkoae]